MLRPNENVKKITKSDGDTHQFLIPISEDEIIFSLNYSGEKDEVLKYDLKQNKFKKLHIQNCNVAKLWRSATNQLLCSDIKKEESFLTGLDGKNVQYIRGYSPMIYIFETDQMIYASTRLVMFTEHHDLYVYDFKTKKSKKLVKDVVTGLSRAVYLPN